MQLHIIVHIHMLYEVLACMHTNQLGYAMCYVHFEEALSYFFTDIGWTWAEVADANCVMSLSILKAELGFKNSRQSGHGAVTFNIQICISNLCQSSNLRLDGTTPSK